MPGPIETATGLGILFTRSVVLEAAYANAVAAVPFLGFPIVYQLWTGAANWLLTKFVFNNAKDNAAIYDIAARKATDRATFDAAFQLASLKDGIKLTDQEKKDEIARLKAVAARMFNVVRRVDA